MSKEIKFRVWSPKDNSLRYLPNLEAKVISWGSVKIESTDDERNEGTFWNYDEAIMQQFTGISDINDKEIYEGDLVSIPITNITPAGNKDESKSIREVKWDSVELKWGLKYPSFDTFSENLSNYKGNIEVIGNVFENKDLLNE